MAVSVTDSLAHVTGGRRYCYVVMTFHKNYLLFERIRKIVSEVTGLECIRADDIPAVGEDLRNKMHTAIEDAALVIGEVSDDRPNIYYELGYAIAKGKRVLILAQREGKIHTNLVGVEILRYDDSEEGLPRLERDLRRQLMPHVDSHVSLLRAMIIPREPKPSYLLVNAKPPHPDLRGEFKEHVMTTYGDYLGVVGVLGAFGSVFGEHVRPELLNPSATPDDYVQWDGNLYLVASPKMNRATLTFLNLLQEGRRYPWRFEPTPDEAGEKDYPERLCGRRGGKAFKSPDLGKSGNRDRVLEEDYGLVLRGPHPYHRHRMVTIMAGSHGLGTSAACLAATKSELIRQIQEKLRGSVDLADQDRTIWVLVKGVLKKTFEIAAEDVTVCDAGAYDRGPRKGHAG